jgi:hypothetical protein
MRALQAALLALCATVAQAQAGLCNIQILWLSNSPALPDAALGGTVTVTAPPWVATGYTGGSWTFPVSAGQGTVTVPNVPIIVTLGFIPTGSTVPTQTAFIQESTTCATTVLPVPGQVGSFFVT